MKCQYCSYDGDVKTFESVVVNLNTTKKICPKCSKVQK